MPMGEFSSFAECVRKNKDKSDPEAYCGKIYHETHKEGNVTANANKKSFMGGVELKEITEATPEGSFSAVFSRFNVIDHDGDVTFPGAFQENQKVPLAGVGHNWDIPVIGVGIIHQDNEKAWVDGLFNLKTQGGREHYESIKFSHEHGLKQEYSYAFDVTKKARADQLISFPGAKRGLEGLDVKEVSAVLMGAGIGTGTLAVKKRSTSKAMNRDWPSHENGSCPICNESLSAHGPGILAIHKELWGSRMKSFKQLSYEQRRDAVSAEIRRRDKIADIEATGEDDYSSPWVMETHEDFVIVGDDDDEGYMKVPYSIASDSSVTLGDPVPVERIWTPMKFSDQGGLLLASLRSFPERTKSLADLRAKEGRTFSQPNRVKLGEIVTAARAAADRLEELIGSDGDIGSGTEEPKRKKLSSFAARAAMASARSSSLSSRY